MLGYPAFVQENDIVGHPSGLADVVGHENYSRAVSAGI